jgi:hypothetical protein
MENQKYLLKNLTTTGLRGLALKHLAIPGIFTILL